MTKTEPRSAGSGGGRDKTTPTELLALADEMRNPSYDDHKFGTNDITREAVTRWSERLRTLATILSAREEVGVAVYMPGTTGFTMATFEAAKVPVGTKLYAPKAPTAGEGHGR